VEKIKTSNPKGLLARSLSKINSLLRNRMPIIRKFYSNRTHYEKRLGIENECQEIKSKIDKLNMRKTIYLKGFYQDISYYTQYKELFEKKRIYPKNPSQKFLKLIANSEMSSLTIVHVRRGDFRENVHNIGLLNGSYYLKAIQTLLEIDSDLKILVVSDDIEEAKEIFPKDFLSIPTCYDQNYLPENPAELLITMSYAKNLILSNSTFSLWSALLSQNSENILYPKPFNLNLPMEVKGFPSNWRAIPSSFEKP
jgi:hypothetical protein